MAWWLAAPVLIWGAKIVIDVITADDRPSYSSGTSSTLSSAKGTRSKLRKRFVRYLIFKHRKKLIEDYFPNALSNGVKVDGSSTASDLLNLIALNELYRKINHDIRLTNSSHIEPEMEVNLVNIFSDIEEEVIKITNWADHEYGEMTGLNEFNSYEKSLDPFITKLRSIHL